ncbi:hypothetical protein B0T24DRAFT_600244 [Lasiosphaeria ovina]|uniref:Uncharacterized protein n=1 Tax=Lasiosphaeria ovina TaxID=92902 RepID=A0AAE0JS54_9PEZI|nr:hypothetical protein B0T24DRAFT_600244 [Lasiosphaeria ovina]
MPTAHIEISSDSSSQASSPSPVPSPSPSPSSRLVIKSPVLSIYDLKTPPPPPSSPEPSGSPSYEDVFYPDQSDEEDDAEVYGAEDSGSVDADGEPLFSGIPVDQFEFGTCCPPGRKTTSSA